MSCGEKSSRPSVVMVPPLHGDSEVGDFPAKCFCLFEIADSKNGDGTQIALIFVDERVDIRDGAQFVPERPVNIGEKFIAVETATMYIEMRREFLDSRAIHSGVLCQQFEVERRFERHIEGFPKSAFHAAPPTFNSITRAS